MWRTALVLAWLCAAIHARDTSLDAEVESYLEETGTPSSTMRATWANRIRLESADGQFRVDVIGWLLWDNDWVDSSEFATSDRSFFRSIRLGVQGHVSGNTVYKIQLEFAGGTVGVRDVFVGLRSLGSIGASVIVGHFKEPFGLEFLNPLGALFFMERSAPTRAFVPDRNVGVMLSSSEAYNLGPRTPGEGWFHNRVAWAIGLFQTTNRQATENENGTGGLTTRISGLVIDNAASNTVLHVAVGGTLRNDDSVRYAADRTLVDTGELAVDQSARLAFEVMFIRGAFSLTAEAFGTSDDLDTDSRSHFWGGYVSIGTWVTGERQAWNIDRVPPTTPQHNFRSGEGGAGGVWIGYRFDYLDLNDGSVRGGDQLSHTVGVIWAWNWNSRVMLNYQYFDVGSGPQGAGTLHLLAVRIQFNF